MFSTGAEIGFRAHSLDVDITSNVEIQTNLNYTLAFYGYLDHVSTPAAFDPLSDIPVASTLYPPTNGSPSELLLAIGSAGLTTEGVSYDGTYSTYLKAAASVFGGGTLLCASRYHSELSDQRQITKWREYARSGGHTSTLDTQPIGGDEYGGLIACQSHLQRKVAGSFLPYISVNDAGPN
ncbi:FAD-binding type 2 [Penicillium robsamsonii]|uniref:FAD-binding type 2 n=1 Tax=Penicillium robsamsonii TaxID=1792511 RepID=UPI002547FE8A|nr:FAD-binding type 2 [Penicillium robsamsonii]KAJ5827857.1 FAD-binding type 2 [Penicillium robsamsonii]